MAANSTKQLLINGFIRQIQQILDETTVIPMDVIKVCCLFYSAPITLFYPSINTSQIYISNESSVCKLVLNPQNNDKPQVIKAGCYVPDISLYVNIKDTELNINKKYDGIVAIVSDNGNINLSSYWSTTDKKYKLNIILFEGNKKYNDILEYTSFVSNEEIQNFPPKYLTYCDYINSIICCDHYGIYQFKLNDINVNTKQFNFTKLSIKDNHNIINDGGASIGYIHGEYKIFGIQGYLNPFERCFNTYSGYNIIKQTKKCGIMDLNKMRWISTNDSLTHKMYKQHTLWEAGICQNNKYNSNIVYIVSNVGHTAKFDIQKEKWLMIMENLEKHSGDKPLVWMHDNPFILYSSYYSKHYRYIDLRDDKKQWIKNNDICRISNDYVEQFFL